VEEEMLLLWNEMQDVAHIQPDQYTIDIMLPIWSRRHDNTIIENVLDEFLKTRSPRVVSDSFSAFMITLNKNGQPLAARSLFQTYIQPGLARTLVAKDRYSRVDPTIIHVNLLLDTYRKEISTLQESDANKTSTESIEKVSKEAWKLFYQLVEHPILDPDDFTLSNMMSLSSSSQQICWLLNYILKYSNHVPLVLQRSAVTAFGKVNDASSAVWFFFTTTIRMSRTSTREWNTLLGALSNACRADNVTNISATDSVAAQLVSKRYAMSNSSSLLNLLDGVMPGIAAEQVLQLMIHGAIDGLSVPKPDTQSFCCAAAALQYRQLSATKVIELYRQARQLGLPAEGRFVNSIFRCYGSDITSALDAWKKEIRPACLEYEQMSQLVPRPLRRRTPGKNLIAAYNGLVYCCGRALRPDIGLRLVYAMNKEGLEPNEITLNCYLSGKRQSQSAPVENQVKAVLQKVAFLDLYEPLLQVECTKYNQNDRRRSGEKRIRIIF
jgi:pentatricopeptide repeat protein